MHSCYITSFNSFYLSFFQGPATREVDTVKENLNPKRASVFTTKWVSNTAGIITLKGPASSVEAEITGGSTTSSQAQSKQEASTTSSKSYAFKNGRVSYGSTFNLSVMFMFAEEHFFSCIINC